MHLHATTLDASPPRDHALDLGYTRVARVAVFHDPEEVASLWDLLEAQAPASVYQTRRWVMPWLETTGRSTGVTPFFVVAFDDLDKPLCLLLLGQWRQGLQRVAGFLGARDTNFNLGLFRPGVRFAPGAMLDVLRAAARADPRRVELFVLRNQPLVWDGITNPLLDLPHQPSPSFAYKSQLSDDADAFLRRTLSADNRKKLRKKMERLSALGPVTHEVARTSQEGGEILDALIAQRRARSRMQGLSAIELDDLRAFLARCSIVSEPNPAVELHALRCGTRIVAAFAGAHHRDRCSGMVISFDSDPDIARFSPGDLLLERLIRVKCRQGVSVFDLGIGEGRYKQTYCQDSEPLFDALVPLSARAKLFAALGRTKLRAKRGIKQSPRAWAVVVALRKLVATMRPTRMN